MTKPYVVRRFATVKRNHILSYEIKCWSVWNHGTVTCSMEKAAPHYFAMRLTAWRWTYRGY